jgi:hypothetical protein
LDGFGVKYAADQITVPRKVSGIAERGLAVFTTRCAKRFRSPGMGRSSVST